MTVMQRPESVQTDGRLPKPWIYDLAYWLVERDYPAHERCAILLSLMDTRTLEHAEERQLLDPEDRAEADALYEQSQPEIGYDQPEWDDPDTWELGVPGTREFLDPAELAADLVRAEPAELRPDWIGWASSLADGRDVNDAADPDEPPALPPICGASEDRTSQPFDPAQGRTVAVVMTHVSELARRSAALDQAIRDFRTMDLPDEWTEADYPF
jgi:hypothetical protein